MHSIWHSVQARGPKLVVLLGSRRREPAWREKKFRFILLISHCIHKIPIPSRLLISSIYTSFHHSLWFLSPTKWAFATSTSPDRAWSGRSSCRSRKSQPRDTAACCASWTPLSEAAVDSKVHCHLKESHISN